MHLKQKKFYNILELYNIINLNKKSICVFVHISNLNSIENNQIKKFCDENNIKNKYIKVNLLKKLTKNSLFLNLLNGPTKLFFFCDINIFLNFFEIFPLKKKVFPLAIFYNNNFFSYLFFINYLKNFKFINGSFDDNFKIGIENFIIKSNKINVIFITEYTNL